MKTTLPRVLVALFALTFVLAACASETGSQWTFAPADGSPGNGETPTESAAPDESAAPAESAVPTESAAPTESVAPEASATPDESSAPTESSAPDESTAPTESAAPAESTVPDVSMEPADPEESAAVGEARVIELESDAAIRFLQDGEQIQSLDVTPGETVLFRVDNTAGFAHNFYIGSDAELQVPSGTTDVGIPDWDTGVQELEWVVPDDVSDIRFACTIAGHHYTMQGDFTVAS